MNGIYQNFQIDLSNNNNFVQYNTIQGDGNGIRGFEVELIENKKPYIISDDVEVFIAGTKPDTKQIFNSCEVTEQGTILVDVTTQMSAVAGRGNYQIVLISKTTNQQIKSFPFIIYVKKSAFNAETITSSNEFHALNGMVNKIESTLNKTDLVDSMLESSSQILEDTTTAYDNAVKSLEKAQDAIETAESINSTALESAENAKQSEENSLLYSNLSKSYAVGTNDESRENDSTDNAKYYKEQAESSSTSALQSANLASQKADDASASEMKAQQYAANASASEANAKSSADNAKTSEENAAQSSSDALQSAANSENSAAASAQSAKKALESATNAGTSETSAKTYAENAEKSAQRAEDIVGITIATPEHAGIVKPDGTTITVDEDGTLHGANNVDGQSIVKTDDNVLKVSDAVLNRLDSLSNANDELSEYVDNRFDAIEDNFGTVDNKIETLEYNLDTTFDEETERNNIVSGEKLSTILGKIKKWFSDLKTVAFTGSYNDLLEKPDNVTRTGRVPNRILVTDNSGNVQDGGLITASELIYLQGIHENIQNKLSDLNARSGYVPILNSDWNSPSGNALGDNYIRAFISNDDPLVVDLGADYKLNGQSAYPNIRVTRAYTDQDGSNIKTTYATKGQLNNYLPLSGGCMAGNISTTEGAIYQTDGNIKMKWANGEYLNNYLANIKNSIINSQIKVVNVKFAMTGAAEHDVTINYREHGFTQCPSWNLYCSNLENTYRYDCYADGNIIRILTRRFSGYGQDTDSFFIHMVGI